MKNARRTWHAVSAAHASCSIGHLRRAVASLGAAVAATVAFTALDGASPLRAQTVSDAVRAPRLNVAVGGMLVGPSRLGLFKAELARGKWALVSDITRDDTRERWEATPSRRASRDSYVLWASSSALRRYTQAGGRGFYVEAGAGMASLSLRSRAGDGAVTTRRATLPLASWGLGARTDLARSRTFVEVAYRSAIPLATRHLHAADTPPDGSTAEPVSYQSWYLGRGKATGQFFAALGFRL